MTIGDSEPSTLRIKHVKVLRSSMKKVQYKDRNHFRELIFCRTNKKAFYARLR